LYLPPDLLLPVLRGVGGIEDEAFVFEEVAKPDGTEINVEKAPVNLFQPDVVASEQGGDEDAVGIPADAAVARDEAGLEMARIGDGLELFRGEPRRRLVEISGHSPVEGSAGTERRKWSD
jgi:hypothetical protein